MSLSPFVSVSVFDKNVRKERQIREGGWLGPFRAEDQLILLVFIHPPYTHFFKGLKWNEDGSPRFQQPRAYWNKKERAKRYRQTLEVLIASNGEPYVKYPDNALGILRLDESGGGFEVWEIAVVAQNGYAFLTDQKVYEDRFYKDTEGNLVCPALANAPQVESFVRRFVPKEDISSIEEYMPPPRHTHSLREGEGEVLWWRMSRGIGAIATTEGVARVFWGRIRGLRPRHGPVSLSAGERVTYTQLLDISSDPNTVFQREAVGVRRE